MAVKVSYCDYPKGTINIVSSKSISNRALIIQGLLGHKISLHNLSESNDTQTLLALMETLGKKNTGPVVLDAGPAGTVMRFLLTYCCIQQREVILTGSERMQLRPIGELVNALRRLGADIAYTGKEGFPPLHIKPAHINGGKLSINAGVSSQFISSLMLCAPYFRHGLQLELTGNIVSPSYILLTAQVMRSFGVAVAVHGNSIAVRPGQYRPVNYTVEGDWSSASYFYLLAALSTHADIELNGLAMDSAQGDKAIAGIAGQFGVITTPTQGGVRISKRDNHSINVFEADFNSCPDIAQTVAVMAAGSNIKQVYLTGLSTLAHKETNRVQAMVSELKKFNVRIILNDDHSFAFDASGFTPAKVQVETYDDHRMAMSFAPLAQKTGEIIIANEEAVKKSYIRFWDDLISLGCLVGNTDI